MFSCVAPSFENTQTSLTLDKVKIIFILVKALIEEIVHEIVLTSDYITLILDKNT